VPTFLLSHHHSPAECGRTFAAWRGFSSPLRHRDALSSCRQGGHGLWWLLEAPDRTAALEQLPECVGHQTEVILVSRVPIP
jgi:hypothetical protein